jgi:hypothetical protein
VVSDKPPGGSRPKGKPAGLVKFTRGVPGKIEQVPAVALAPDADRFQWARDFRREIAPTANEKLVAQVIAEFINTEPDKPYFGTAFAGYPAYAGAGGLTTRAVEEAVPAIRKRGFIITRKVFSGPLIITLAMPANWQFRDRPGNWEELAARYPLNFPHVRERVSHTSATPVSRPSGKHINTYQNTNLKKQAGMEEEEVEKPSILNAPNYQLQDHKGPTPEEIARADARLAAFRETINS